MEPVPTASQQRQKAPNRIWPALESNSHPPGCEAPVQTIVPWSSDPVAQMTRTRPELLMRLQTQTRLLETFSEWLLMLRVFILRNSQIVFKLCVINLTNFPLFSLTFHNRVSDSSKCASTQVETHRSVCHSQQMSQLLLSAKKNRVQSATGRCRAEAGHTAGGTTAHSSWASIAFFTQNALFLKLQHSCKCNLQAFLLNSVIHISCCSCKTSLLETPP